ncbi:MULTISPECIES: hypothetical protein [Pectobacterium]|uniref:hypothetical protein n=1 Tax=Pectobacterium TaxID=122277 RepID=UPI00057DA6A7|nr:MULTISPECIES: hypothetical protein [Pectobacterium]KHT23394.1 hypothetical protein RC96_02950 [Pectobacterium carotovorum subsp. carotovorum]KHT29565.1 hypothetical protein RC98_01750 [Pectobacterium carotovorum subsp. carotovorum]KHT37410.1 hypothetical protein RC99_07900 [Pectobacterium carotovorum subsp. carotovorum]MBA0179139.1 hypothetical protein [Pectobacterium carotovorum]MBA0190953.1 hypothetical protein [Pectobacterium carotovorum]
MSLVNMSQTVRNNTIQINFKNSVNLKTNSLRMTESHLMEKIVDSAFEAHNAITITEIDSKKIEAQHID